MTTGTGAAMSRGTDLSYYVEFGDGAVSTQARVVHTIDQGGSLTARLTVVDRFGRSDSEVFPYFSFALTQPPNNFFSPNYSLPRVNLELTFRTRAGRSYGGTVTYGSSSATFVANLTGE